MKDMDNGIEPDELEEELALEMMGGQFVDGAFFGKKAFEQHQELQATHKSLIKNYNYISRNIVEPKV